MSSFDPIKNQADFIRDNGIDAFGSVRTYVQHQENLWNMLIEKATKDAEQISNII